MTPKGLLIFVTVYREENYTAAAKRLGISQPAVSSSIRELEKEYHVQLFRKEGRGIKRTRHADKLYGYASHITSLYEEMDQAFLGGDDKIPLRIGSSISIGSCLLPGCIQEYRKAYQAPMPYIQVDSSDRIEQQVLDNRLDFAVIEGLVHSDQLLCEPVIKDRLVLVCGKDHPLAKKKVVSVNDIRDEYFLMREKNSGTREAAESAIIMQNFSMKVAMESTSTTAIINSVICNLGLTILPERILQPYLADGRIVELYLNDARFTRENYLIYHQNKYLNPEILQAMNFIKEYIMKHEWMPAL